MTKSVILNRTVFIFSENSQPTSASPPGTFLKYSMITVLMTRGKIIFFQTAVAVVQFVSPFLAFHAHCFQTINNRTYEKKGKHIIFDSLVKSVRTNSVSINIWRAIQRFLSFSSIFITNCRICVKPCCPLMCEDVSSV